MQINRNIFPSGGYTFKERDGSIHKGKGWGELTQKVTAYRVRLGWPIDDVMADITRQFCATYPASCFTASHAPVPPAGNGGKEAMTFTQRILHWFIYILSQKRLNKIVTVDESMAAARAMICQRCPKQRALSDACGACTRSVVQSRKATLNSGSSHQHLLSCAVLGEDTSISVHLLQAPTAPKDLPAECWRRQG